MNWKDAIEKYIQFKILTPSKQPEEIRKEVVNDFKYMLEQMSELTERDPLDINNEFWEKSYRSFKDRNRKLFPTFDDLFKWRKFRELVRLLVFTRDNYRCQYCGSEKNLCLEHVIPISGGGGWNLDNLVCACNLCNRAKLNLTREQFINWLIGVAKNIPKKIPDKFKE